MLLDALNTVRDLARLQEIAAVLIRHGFGELIRRTGIGTLLEKAGRRLPWLPVEDLAQPDLPQRVRHALEDMGPSFIKLGQLLSTRVDLLPPPWIEALAQLQRCVPPVPFDALRAQLETELGAPIDALFAEFRQEPLATASIAQAHRARLPDGREVIVKIRRPGIEKVIDADLSLMRKLARILEAHIPELQYLKPSELVHQFGVSIHRELNFIHESRSTERIFLNFAGNDAVVIPQVHWDYVRESVLVQDYIDGIGAADRAAIRAAAIDPKAMARIGADAMFQMILLDGFFHADPHQGNVLFLPDNRIAFVDFGMVGRLSSVRRQQLVDLLYALVDRDPTGAAEVLLAWTEAEVLSPEQLLVDLDQFIDDYHGAALKQISLTRVLGELMALIRAHRLSLPPDLALLFRTLIALDGMGRQNDPDFDIFTQAVPFLARALRQRYQPEVLARRSWRNAVHLAEVLGVLPAELRRLLRLADRGRLRLNLDLARLEQLGGQLERAAAWVAISLVTAALIVGSAIVMTLTTGPTLLGLPAFGVLGSLLAVAGALWLIGAIRKAARSRPPRP